MNKEILEEKLMKKMKQATYYKKKYQEANNIIKEAIEYHNNCIENLDLCKINDNEKLAYEVAYEIHKRYLEILGSDKE